MAADPKLSGLDENEREQALAYVRSRWSQYSSATRDARKDSATFVATINAGGAAAILAFSGATLGKSGDISLALPLRLSILFFVFGVTLSAIAHVIESGRLNKLFADWRSGVDDLYNDKVSFNQLRLDDLSRAGNREPAFGRIVCGALICFMIGAFSGLILLFGGR